MMSLLVWLPGPMFLLRSLCLGGGVFVQGVSVWGSLSRGTSVQGGFSPEWSLSGGSLSRESLSRGFSVQGMSVQGDSVKGVSVGDGEEMAVRILLECFLVLPKQMKSPDPLSRFG